MAGAAVDAGDVLTSFSLPSPYVLVVSACAKGVGCLYSPEYREEVFSVAELPILRSSRKLRGLLVLLLPSSLAIYAPYSYQLAAHSKSSSLDNGRSSERSRAGAVLSMNFLKRLSNRSCELAISRRVR